MLYTSLMNETTLRDLRLSCGLTQEQLAERMDTSAVYISQVENGFRRPSIKWLRRLSETLEIDLSRVLTAAGIEKSPEADEAEIATLIATDPDAAEVLEFLKDYPQQRRVVARFIRGFLKGELEEEKGASGGREPGRSAATENTG